MRRYTKLICAAGAVLWASSACAEVLETFKVHNWQAGAYTRRGTSLFNHCAASAKYNSGVSMMFAINSRYRWSMGFYSPQWNLVQGQRYSIAFQIDDSSPISAQATAIGRGQVEVQLADSTTLFERFRWGQRLRVASAGQVLTFKLTDTADILPALLRCVKRYVSAEPPSSATGFFNPPRPAPDSSSSSAGFFGSPRPAPEASPTPAPAPAPAPTPVHTGGNQAEATALVANLLAQSGINGFRILGPNEIPNLKADAAWKAEKVIGTVSVLSGGGLSLDQIPGRVIGNAAQSCRGKFFSGSLPDTKDGSGIARVFTACQKDDNTITVYYLGVPRPNGGFYVLTTSAVGSEQPAKEADQNLRSAVFKVLSK